MISSLPCSKCCRGSRCPQLKVPHSSSTSAWTLHVRVSVCASLHAHLLCLVCFYPSHLHRANSHLFLLTYYGVSSSGKLSLIASDSNLRSFPGTGKSLLPLVFFYSFYYLYCDCLPTYLSR